MYNTIQYYKSTTTNQINHPVECPVDPITGCLPSGMVQAASAAAAAAVDGDVARIVSEAMAMVTQDATRQPAPS
jgi:hypothetical protein